VAEQSKAWTVSPAQTLRSWVEIPLEAWKSVCIHCMIVCGLRFTSEPYRLCVGLRNWTKGQGQTMGCRAIDDNNNNNNNNNNNKYLHSYVFVADFLIKDRDKVTYHSNNNNNNYYYCYSFYYDSQKYNNLAFVDYFIKSYIRWPNTVRHPGIKLFPLNRCRSPGTLLRNKGVYFPVPKRLH
jgi:hypothetical protein